MCRYICRTYTCMNCQTQRKKMKDKDQMRRSHSVFV